MDNVRTRQESTYYKKLIIQMGRINHERHIHFYYHPLFIQHWNEQNETFKNICRDLGEPYGYSGMNVFYIWLFIWLQYYWAGMDLDQRVWIRET